MAKSFNKEYYSCYSPELREFLNSKGLGLGVESDTIWHRGDRIRFLESRDIPYDKDKIVDLPRKRWDFSISLQLSDALEEWSNNKPSK